MMPNDYSENFAAAMTSLNGIDKLLAAEQATTGDPKEPVYGQGTRGKLRDQMDVRDIVTGLVATGINDLKSPMPATLGAENVMVREPTNDE